MSQEEPSTETIRPSLKSLWGHWLILILSVLLVVMSGPILSVAQQWLPALDQLLSPILLQIAGAAGIVYAGIVRIGYILLANRYFLTHEEIIEVYGLIQRNRRATRLEHIRRVTVEVSFIGRVLGYGDVLYFTSGSGGVDVRLKNIPDPEGLAGRVEALTKAADQPPERSEEERASDDRLIAVLERIESELSELRAERQKSRGENGRLAETVDLLATKISDLSIVAEQPNCQEVAETRQSTDTEHPDALKADSA